MKEVDMSKFCVFILAHGRPNITDTYDHLLGGGYTGKIIFLVDNEDDKVNGYYEKYGNENVYMFDKIVAAKECDPMNNFGGRRATLFARNKAFDVAKTLGYDYFLVLDDDYYYFGHRGEYGAKKLQNLIWCSNTLLNFLQTHQQRQLALVRVETI